MRKALYLLAVLGLAGTAFAASNTGTSEDGPLGAHVLTPGIDGVAAVTILYAPSEADDAAFRGAIAAITGGVVDYFDARVATPDAALLAQYDCVFTWVNFSMFDSVLMGDRLADHVDAGGTAVLGAFSTYTTGNSLGGRIMQVGYNPVTSPSGTNHFATSAYAGDGTSYLHAGVAAYDAFYRDFLTLQGTGIQDGSYVDGEIAQAYRPDGGVVYSNGAGGAPVIGTGDWPQLIANACGRAIYVQPLIQEIPTVSVLGLTVLALALGASALWIWRRRSIAH
jgi:hypothetical protein